MKFLLFGGKGWIGQKLVDLLMKDNHEVHLSNCRLENYSDILNELNNIKPDFVLNSAGIKGFPTVDWCEENKETTMFINVAGILNLVNACHISNVHVTNYCTGCIYSYNTFDEIFTENDKPNFTGSTYSKTKVISEETLSVYNNVLNLRIRLPVSSDLDSRGLIGKLSNYKKVIDVPNSVTILDEMLPISIDMTIKRFKGTFNFVNPGLVKWSFILECYQKYVDKNFKFDVFTTEEQDKILKAPRSNCCLDNSKLENYYKLTDANIMICEIIKNFIK